MGYYIPMLASRFKSIKNKFEICTGRATNLQPSSACRGGFVVFTHTSPLLTQQ